MIFSHTERHSRLRESLKTAPSTRSSTQLRFLCLDDFGALFLRMPRSMTKTVGRINRPATNFKPVTFG